MATNFCYSNIVFRQHAVPTFLSWGFLIPLKSQPAYLPHLQPRGSFASVLKGVIQKRPLSDQLEPALVLDDSCLKERDFGLSLVGQVKEVSAIPNLYIILAKEGFDSVKLSYLGGLWVFFEFDSFTSMEKFRNHVGIGSWFSMIKAALALKWGDLVVWEESEEISLSCKHICLKIKVDEIINESFKIIVKGKVFWIRIKELDAWIPKFLSDNNDSSSDTNSTVHEEGCKPGDYENEIPNIDSDVEQVSDTSCMHGNDYAQEPAPKIHRNETPHSNDPFGIYELLQQKKENMPQSNDFGPTHPLGFTPDIHNKNNGEGTDSLKNKEKSNTSKKSFTRHNVEALSQ
ncbi:hypothetical protein Tco_0629188 [Tanacetum coccineum]|uniref:DUF4283 domain-containing protein n=1 Tax=Tanacetum coccineum TaxID=301880 RepID=A0ABQ4WSF8_9ASTR